MHLDNGTDPLERVADDAKKEPEGQLEIVWKNVAMFAALHAAAFYGLYLAIFYAKWQTLLLSVIIVELSALGVTAGAHRLWCHKAYKAKLPLRVFLMICNSVALENSIFEYSRDHRVHHKYTETDADPTNVNRGLFFAHIGWLMCKKHPEVIRKGKAIDCSDLLRDPLVAFQHRYYVPLTGLFCFMIPTLLAQWLCGEPYWTAFFVCGIFRYVTSLHGSWLVNSAAHKWGSKPYDKHIAPVENFLVSAIASGEGFHNYHHAFPWDYSASELGWVCNLTTMFIDAMAKLGLAYDRKTVSKDMLRDRMIRTGDGTRQPPK